MGLGAHFLADTSAVARIAQPAIRARLQPLMEVGVVARCATTDLEAGVSARSGPDWTRTRAALDPWPRAPIDEPVLDRAYEVQRELANRGLHRTAKIGDLVVAAAAEVRYLIVGGQQNGGPGGSSGPASQITAWVEAHYKAVTIGGQTVYDLTQAV